jgi:hypothetical protein
LSFVDVQKKPDVLPSYLLGRIPPFFFQFFSGARCNRAFRVRLHCAGGGRDGHRHAENLFGSCRQRQTGDSQLLSGLRIAVVHAGRGGSRSDVHPFSTLDNPSEFQPMLDIWTSSA